MSRHFPKYASKKPKKAAAADVESWRSLILAHSAYLSANLEQYAGLPADPGFAAALDAARKEADAAPDTGELMATLRRAKRKIAALTAIADLKYEWDDLTVMRRLSEFADFAVTVSLEHLLREAHARKTIRLPNLKDPLQGCGVAVIALGKWGAFELNYSSDIDLMVLFDPQKSPVKDKDETQNFFIRLTRDLARILDQPTEDGYVFRTDLRLRPDPGAMPLAVSIGTAETYYGSLGQNWERAAMIKSRPVAGDAAVGADFMKIMSSWIWRRNLDFAAIQDIHSIKRQINAKQAHKGRATAKGNPFLNFNVKLGHGGIREIEFFAQTQQLIYGGREPRLREAATLAALAALASTGHIPEEVRARLEKAYLFLRRVEHRLQMQDDRQTHTLPAATTAFADFSRFMEYASPEKFTADLAAHTGAVKKLYAELFTESPSLAGPGNLVFTGVEDDPETLETLKKMGFAEPARVTSAIRGWHHGRYRAVRSERARQILTELVPHLLKAFSGTPHPDDAFIRFDRFLERLPSGIPIFSMFMKHPPQMELVADVMGTSPALAGHLGTHPQVLDGVLSRDFFGRLPDLAWLKEELSRYLTSARDYQDILDFTRRWAREKRFHAGIHILRRLSEHGRCRLYLSDIAEAALSCLVPLVENEFAQAHGRFRTGEFILLGMGSFAAQEMFADSDLDIVALYRTDAREKTSDGDKPLPPNVYYIRLMQRLIAALTAPTAEGILYDVDARLRPAGEKGPIAAQLEGFFEYQRKDAWVWEHMSLIRSRLVYAAPKTAATFNREIEKILSDPRDEKKLRHDMLDMRARVEKQFGSKDNWNMKYRRGGIMDIMFAAHFLVLQNAAKHDSLFHPSLEETLQRLQAKKLVSKRDAAPLLRALQHAQDVQSYLRLAAELPFDPSRASPGLGNALAASVTGKKKAAFKPFAATLQKGFAASYAAYKRIMK
ncbi:MAG: bifunctional [glutamine synthetase] adenylyltransferase/[glutamine synthetase]-adenylyl-L-tyrosine phosphorylase [Alphaproteobacteria bacterium]|nr:MAG: bifunctional [glutamine synthetase] adenylyltransferase/[glutamine synthetase]-adenylyl-L-tyrosine phosphorylase [Alphaproteobacteria bacterium]